MFDLYFAFLCFLLLVPILQAMKHEYFAEQPLPHKNAFMDEGGNTYTTREIHLVSQMHVM
jgi:hypothetical protein